MAPKTGVHGLKGPESKNTKKAKTPKATGVHTLGGPQTAATATPKGSSSAKKANTLSEMRADEHERRPSKRAKLAAQDNEDYVDDPADAVAADEDEDDLDEWGDGLWAAEFETDEEDLQDESDQEPFADDPDMEEDEIEQQNVHEYINEKGEFVSVPGEQVSEQEVAEKLRRDSTRVQHMHKLFKMIYRMVSLCSSTNDWLRRTLSLTYVCVDRMPMPRNIKAKKTRNWTTLWQTSPGADTTSFPIRQAISYALAQGFTGTSGLRTFTSV